LWVSKGVPPADEAWKSVGPAGNLEYRCMACWTVVRPQKLSECIANVHAGQRIFEHKIIHKKFELHLP
jgi:hypothetical protein